MDFNWILPENFLERLDPVLYKIKYVELMKKLKTHRTQKLYKICDSVKCGPFGSTVLAESYSSNGVLYLRPVNISDNNFSDKDITFLTNKDVEEKNLDSFCGNDLFFARVGNPSVSKVSSQYNKITISPNIVAVKVGNKIDSDYLWMFLSSKYGMSQVERMLKTVAQPTTSTETIKGISVLMPSVEIQKYIGDKVRKAEELREEAKRLKKEAEDLLDFEIGNIGLDKENKKCHWIKSNKIDDRIDGDFYDLKYEILVNIEEKIDCYLMEDIIVDKYTGKTPDKAFYNADGVPLIVVKNVEENVINLENIEIKIKNSNLFKKIEIGDLLITRVGSVGIVSIVEENDAGAFLSDNVICIKLRDNIEKRYISFYLNSKYGKLMIERWTKGAVQGVINYPSINRFKIPALRESVMKHIDLKILSWKNKLSLSKQLIKNAKQDIEDLIEGNFDMSKVKEINEH